jgi:prolyl oligopeptidase
MAIKLGFQTRLLKSPTMNRCTLRQSLKICVILAASCCLRLAATDYPAAKRGPQFDDYFGQKILDPYRWLEDINSPRTAKWIAAERAYTAAAFAAMPERDAIRSRLKELWDFP